MNEFTYTLIKSEISLFMKVLYFTFIKDDDPH